MRPLEKVSLLFLATIAVSLAALNVLVWQGIGVDDELEQVRPTTTPEREPAAQPRDRTATIAERRTAAPAAERRQPGRPLLRFELAAVRGDCWMSVRRGSAEGEVLYEGLLASGETLRFTARRLWLRLGAASNIELRVNGRVVEGVPAGTVDLVVPPPTA
jgi:uncharacterized protein DUF4115